MIKIENVKVMGWEQAIRGMRNPMNSWDKSDSGICKGGDDGIGCHNCAKQISCEHTYDHSFQLGKNDYALMMRLAAVDPVHAKYRRMITVYADITAPLYWWNDFKDIYNVDDADSGSEHIMATIQEKEFEWSDFSIENLTNFGMWVEQFTDADAFYAPAKVMGCVISALNGMRHRYLDFKSRGPEWKEQAKQAWWQMIQLLPSSYNQKRTVMLNYEVLARIYSMRKDHKLDEWRESNFAPAFYKVLKDSDTNSFCDWIKTLPYSELITAPGIEDIIDKINTIGNINAMSSKDMKIALDGTTYIQDKDKQGWKGI